MDRRRHGRQPDITARTIRETLARQRALVLDLYHRECRDLANKLSQGTSRVGVDGEFTSVPPCTRDTSAGYGAVPLRHRDMPYRVAAAAMTARLQAPHTDGSYPYESPEEFSSTSA